MTGQRKTDPLDWTPSKPEDIVAEIGREYDRMATETLMTVLAVLGTVAVLAYYLWEILS